MTDARQQLIDIVNNSVPPWYGEFARYQVQRILEDGAADAILAAGWRPAGDLRQLALEFSLHMSALAYEQERKLDWECGNRINQLLHAASDYAQYVLNQAPEGRPATTSF